MRHYDKYAIDFGRDNKQVPLTIIQPTTINDIQQAVTNARNMQLAVRGKAHSTGGQTLVADGVVFDMTTYANVGDISTNNKGHTLLEVQAGALWKDVFNHCLANGLTPPTYSDWLDLTVGGTLSTGGVGQCSFKNGLQIDNVEQLEVVTANGDVLLCSDQENKDLFDLVRGGYGQYGIISRAWLRLEKAPQDVFVYQLIYSDLAEFLAALNKLTYHQEIDAIQSHVVLAEKEELHRRIAMPITDEVYDILPPQPYYFLLEVTRYVNDKYTLDSFNYFLLNLTRHNPALIFAQQTRFAQHVNRVPPLLTNPLEKNLPQHHHCCFFIATDNADKLLRQVLSNPEHQAAMGQGSILIVPMKRSKINAPYFMLPQSEDILFIGILRRHVAPCSFDVLIRLNEETYKTVIELEGRIYAVGSGTFLADPRYWQWHYGKYFNNILLGKGRYDPKRQLTPNIKMVSVYSVSS